MILMINTVLTYSSYNIARLVKIIFELWLNDKIYGTNFSNILLLLTASKFIITKNSLASSSSSSHHHLFDYFPNHSWKYLGPLVFPPSKPIYHWAAYVFEISPDIVVQAIFTWSPSLSTPAIWWVHLSPLALGMKMDSRKSKSETFSTIEFI